MVANYRSKPKRTSNSPIFPAEVFSPTAMTFNVPENEIVSSHSVSLSILLAEPLLYLRGFTAQEYNGKPATILRGALILRIQKPTKIKLVSLSFKGIARTEWPEGIPPKKQEIVETKEIHLHVWPFFNASSPNSDVTSGANMVRFMKDSSHRINLTTETSPSTPGSNTTYSSSHRNRSNSPSSDKSSSRRNSHHTRSNPSVAHNRSESTESTNAIKAFADRILRAASPSPIPKPNFSAANRSSSSSNIVSSTHASTFSSRESSFHALVPRRSFSKDEHVDSDAQSKGYRTFEPGEYYYNFELPIPQSLPETINCNFGSVRYSLEAVVERSGTFKTKVHGSKEVVIIRAPSDNNLEISEPIAISKSWEDQLYYEIVISGKAFPIGTHIPIAFKLTPLAKVELHRIRVYVTENCEYYCKNKKVHRIEPTKKFMLDEVLSKDGLQGNLLHELAPSGRLGDGDTEGCSIEHELNTFVPTEFPIKKEILHPNSTYDNIKVHHWIKVVLRISRRPPDASQSQPPLKRKHYEISIDSPIQLLDPHCTNANVFLPAYIDPVSRRSSVSALRRPVPASELDERGMPIENDLARPIHFLRKPSIAPPPFDADEAPPPAVDTDESSAISMISEASSWSSLNFRTGISTSARQSVNSLDSNNTSSPPEPSIPPPPYESAIRDNTTSYNDRFRIYQQSIRNSQDKGKRNSEVDPTQNGFDNGVDSITTPSQSTPLSDPVFNTAMGQLPIVDDSNVSINTTGSSGDSGSDSSLYRHAPLENTSNAIATETAAALQRDRLPSIVSAVDITNQIHDDSSSINEYTENLTRVTESVEIGADDAIEPSVDSSSSFSLPPVINNSQRQQTSDTSSVVQSTVLSGIRNESSESRGSPTTSNINVNTVRIDTPTISPSSDSVSESSNSELVSSSSTSNSVQTSTNIDTTSGGVHSTPTRSHDEQNIDPLAKFDDCANVNKDLEERFSKHSIKNSEVNNKPFFKTPNFNNTKSSFSQEIENQKPDHNTHKKSNTTFPADTLNDNTKRESENSNDSDDDYNDNILGNDNDYIQKVLDRKYTGILSNGQSSGHRPSVAPLMMGTGIVDIVGNDRKHSREDGEAGEPNDHIGVGLERLESYNSFNNGLEGSVGIIGCSSMGDGGGSYADYTRYGGYPGFNGLEPVSSTSSELGPVRLNSVGDLGLRQQTADTNLDSFGRRESKTWGNASLGASSSKPIVPISSISTSNNSTKEKRG